METSIRIVDYYLKERIEGQDSKITLAGSNLGTGFGILTFPDGTISCQSYEAEGKKEIGLFDPQSVGSWGFEKEQDLGMGSFRPLLTE